MALNHSPQIVTNGLVYYHDMSNTQKSWKGSPTVNLIPNSTFSTGSISPWSYQDVANGNATIVTSVKYDDYNSARITRTSIGGESNMWLNLSAAEGLLPNTQYTFSAYSLAYSPNQASIFSFFSTTSNGSITHSGSGRWERLVHTFTTRSTEPYVQIRMWHNTTLLNNPVWFTELQVEQKTFATPFVNGTRTTSNNIIDLTGTNTVTATSLTYNSDNTFSFNGTGSISFTNPLSAQTNLGQEWTVIAWVNIDTSINQRLITGLNFGLYLTTGSNSSLLYLNGGVNDYYTYGGAIGGVGWCQVVFRFRNSDGARTIYKNGVNISTGGPNLTSIPSGNLGTLTLGTSVNGLISNTMIYNRYITDAEVLQNFNALRGRYGL